MRPPYTLTTTPREHPAMNYEFLRQGGINTMKIELDFMVINRD